MAKRMLIDAAYEEDVRVLLVEGKEILDFHHQNNLKKSTKGNIYLAKITRIEPSLQAAFVEYGGKKHGFLPFSEIHPDYYQIPVADRESLNAEIDEVRSKKLTEELDGTEAPESSVEDPRTFRSEFHKRYKIQEVIKKDQVMLVQIEKEERGNKGSALTTYISFAGRYCVFLPNATKGGGVSKKIGDDEDRQRLKKAALELTKEMDKGAVIIRTAGSYKTKTEIKKDLAHLQKIWANIKQHTVNSIAPTFIHEEGDIIKKSIRDLYDANVEEIVVSGDHAYKSAKEFMQMLLPKHSSKLKQYEGKASILNNYDLDRRVADLYAHEVSLPSGGYIIINQTEALVAIDVNSGRSTSERSVESTAIKTNMEAAREVARQIRLRDLSGLIVVDFIDMEESKNRSSVERAFRDAISEDKAKIFMGKISSLGLLELSRQRLKQSFLETNSKVCDHCGGRGRVRRVESTGIAILRAIENEFASTDSACELHVHASSQMLVYLLNHRRDEIERINKKFETTLVFGIDETAGPDGFFIDKKNIKRDREESNALSKIDDVHVDEPRVEEERREKRPIKSKFRIKKAPELAEIQPLASEDDTMSDNDGEQRFPQKKKKRFKKKKKFPSDSQQEGNRPSDSDDSQDFDQEMAEKRKQHQSLLKEIWKKIVD